MARPSKQITHRAYPSTKTGMKLDLRDMDGVLVGSYKLKGQCEGACKALGGKLQRMQEPFDEAVHVKPKARQFSVEKRFGFMNTLINMFATKITKGAVICGPAGVGKTHACLTMLDRRGMEEGIDYKVIKGSISPNALYQTLWENSDKAIIFDDCDSALFNPDCANILKAVLDTCDRRVVSWITSTTLGSSGPPPSFEFKGQILFISNLSEDRLDKAIVSRAICLDLRMDKGEIMDRIEQLSMDICSEVLEPMEITEITSWMRANLDTIFDLNLRTLIKLAQIRNVQKDDWEDAAAYMFTR